jgi:hypothetical protein
MSSVKFTVWVPITCVFLWFSQKQVPINRDPRHEAILKRG